MIVLVSVQLADAVVNGMACLSIGLVGYLFCLRFRERREQKKVQRERDRDRRKHWGYI
ncbi:MAG: hypothetical protein ABSD29_06970 [Verrucomicrobiota bacterium]